MRVALPAFFHVLQRFVPPGRASITPAPQSLQRLQKGATLVLHEPRGVQLEVVSGDVWITHDGDCKDVTLVAGEHYTSERPARMLVHGLADAVVLLH